MSPPISNAARPDAGARREPDIGLRRPRAADGQAMWQLAGDVGVDLNSPYAYVLWGDAFSESSVVATVGDRLVGFVTGFRKPDDPDVLFVWQIGVAPDQRGKGIAGCMLDHLIGYSEPSYMEATVTPTNRASAAMFRAVGRRFDAPVVETLAFPEQYFPGGHEAEVRFRIGPLARD